MKRMLFAVAAAALLFAAPAFAQTQDNLSLGTIISNVQQGAATVHQIGPKNTGDKGVMCTFNQVSHSGSPSTTFSIDFEDAASATWQAMVTSGAITNDTTPTTIVAYPGSVATSVPTGMVIAGLHVPVNWRVTETVGGTGGEVINGTIGCDLLH
jgi:hypothetical protein